MEEWEKHMVNFVPDDMISFTVAQREVEILVEPL
jgi:hypothetical protein